MDLLKVLTKKSLQKACILGVILSFSATSVSAQGVSLPGHLVMPAPGNMVGISTSVEPVLLRGVALNPQDPLLFDFIISESSAQANNFSPLQEESEKLIKYFLAALTVPEQDLWVNLSPYEDHRIIADGFGQTEMGRDLLAQDYLLKQLTASLLYPEGEMGKQFWDKVYTRAAQELGHADIPVDTFHKVWIVPDKSVVYEHETTAYIVEASLKVMLERDYYASKTKDVRSKTYDANSISTDVMRDVIIPVIEDEVNHGENFAPLRQIYHAIILANWFKQRFKQSVLHQGYADQNKIVGVNHAQPGINKDIYDQYVQALKKGVYSYIKEERDLITQEYIPRKYFSGGADFAMKVNSQIVNNINPTRLPNVVHHRSTTRLNPVGDHAMRSVLTQAGPSLMAFIQASIAQGPGVYSPELVSVNVMTFRQEAVKELTVHRSEYLNDFDRGVGKAYAQSHSEVRPEDDTWTKVPNRMLSKLPLDTLRSIVYPDQQIIIGLEKEFEKDGHREGLDKNVAANEVLVTLLAKHLKANVGDIITADIVNALGIPINGFLAGEGGYIAEFISDQTFDISDLENTNISQNSARLLALKVLLNTIDHRLGNLSFVQGIPVSVDHDLVLPRVFLENRIKSNHVFFYGHFLMHAIGHAAVTRYRQNVGFYEDFKKCQNANLESEAGLERIANFINKYGLGYGYIEAEQLTRRNVEQAIREIQSITRAEFDLFLRLAGHQGAEAERLGNELEFYQARLGTDMNELWKIFTGGREDPGWDQLDQAMEVVDIGYDHDAFILFTPPRAGSHKKLVNQWNEENPDSPVSHDPNEKHIFVLDTRNNNEMVGIMSYRPGWGQRVLVTDLWSKSLYDDVALWLLEQAHQLSGRQTFYVHKDLNGIRQKLEQLFSIEQADDFRAVSAADIGVENLYGLLRRENVRDLNLPDRVGTGVSVNKAIKTKNAKRKARLENAKPPSAEDRGDNIASDDPRAADLFAAMRAGALPDMALQTEATGGVDFRQDEFDLDVQGQSKGFNAFDEAMTTLLHDGVVGLKPVVIRTTRIDDLSQELGLTQFIPDENSG